MATSGLIFSYKTRDLPFFDELKKNLEDLVCPVCHEISSEPVQTSCGHLFCKECLKDPTCPVCRQSCTSMPDHFNARRIKGLKVGCSNEGCDWKGDLGDVTAHFVTCLYESITCSNKCGKKSVRWRIVHHISLECPFRMVECDYCQWEDKANMLSDHLTVCPLLPVQCPNGCGLSMPREKLMGHSETCPKRLVKCKYFRVGCRELIQADKMADHLLQAKDDHLGKAMDKVVELSVAMESVCQQIQSLRDPPNPVVLQPWLRNPPELRVCPCVIEMSEFSKKRSEVWFSPPFYTHPGGYRIRLDVYSNGRQESKGVHLSTYVCLMRGEYDDNLKWPFSFTVKFTLLNQVKDSNHVSYLVKFCDASEKANGRVTKSNIAQNNRGKRALLPLSELVEDGTRKVQFLKNDCLFFKVEIIMIL